MKLAPVETLAPPVAAVYHWAVPVVQVAPKVTVPVPQIAAGVTVGVVGMALMVAVTNVLTDSQFCGELLQLTKYVVVAEMLGVVKLPPVETLAPPVAVLYHWATPVAQVASKVTVPVPQIAAGVTVGAFGIALMVAATGVLLDSQPSVVLQLA